MQIERVRPTVFRVTFHAYELSTLIAAARWAIDGGEGEFPEDARKQLRDLLETYDRQLTATRSVD